MKNSLILNLVEINGCDISVDMSNVYQMVAVLFVLEIISVQFYKCNSLRFVLNSSSLELVEQITKKCVQFSLHQR